MKRYVRVMIFLLMIGSIWSNHVQIAKALTVETDRDGNYFWTLIDTKKTSNVSWSTEGYTVKANKCLPEGKPQKGKYGKFMLQDSWKQSVDKGGEIETTFTVPHELVDEQAEKAGVNPKSLQKNGGNLYLNGIFQVWHKQKKYGPLHTNLKGIQNAEWWKNKKDFEDHFDIKVPYKPLPQKIQITYSVNQDSKWKRVSIIDTKDSRWKMEKLADKSFEQGSGLGFQTNSYPIGSEIHTDGKSLPAKISAVVDGVSKECYLYRVHWAYLRADKKDYPYGTYRPTHGTEKLYTNPLADWDGYVKELDRIRKRSFTVQRGGLEIVAVYKTYKKPTDKTQTDESELIEPNPSGMIQSEVRDIEQFDSETGIPTSENQYVNVFTTDYLRQYKFKNYSGTKLYPQKEDYYVEENGKKVKKTKTIHVSRSYSYWKIESFAIYKLEKATIRNYSLPGEKVVLKPSEAYQVPSVSYHQKGRIEEPAGVGTYQVGEIKCYNDKLVFNGKTIMDGTMHTKQAPAPSKIPYGKKINRDVLYVNGNHIDAEKSNGEYESTGTVSYQAVAQIGGKKKLQYEIEDINSVLIHTPTICDAKAEDVRLYNQSLYPDMGENGLVLDRNFLVELPTTGFHTDKKGYGYRDYEKYISERQVKFPFDVYENQTYYPANTWLTLKKEKVSFYLPIWVQEGDYTIEFRAKAINCKANQGEEETEELANTEESNYVATDTVDVYVVGRLYGLSLYDVSDYPIWEPVFRKPNTLQLTGVDYRVGVRNQNGEFTGRKSKFTLPMVNGDHAILGNQGVLKTGYTARMYLTTIGNLWEEKDQIQIKPNFYWIDSHGNREAVDVYYTESIQGKKEYMVQMGSEMDQKNVKKMTLGNPYTSVGTEEMKDKVWITRRSEKSIKADTAPIYTYTNIKIPEALRTYIGKNDTPTGRVPSGVSETLVGKSKQRWYFEYSMPAEIHVCPQTIDPYQYGRLHAGIDYNEPFWKKDGYLAVQFDITTVRGEERRLNYINAANARNGYCNMWKMEGFSHQKTDYQGVSYRFQEGDVLLYYLGKSVTNDFKSYGTH